LKASTQAPNVRSYRAERTCAVKFTHWGVMETGLHIDVTNYSTVEWFRNNWHVGVAETEGVPWDDEITKTPLEKLVAGASTMAGADQEWLKQFVEDELWVILGYGNEQQGNFAVRVNARFHFLTVGGRSQWSVWDGTKWTEPTDDTTVYTWEFPKTRVVATPTIEDDAASVSISISTKH
jgi:hypothetical protein